MILTTTGKSLLNLLYEYGIGDGGIYAGWWKSQPFAKEKPEAGTYEIELRTDLNNMTLEEQSEVVGGNVAHVALVAEAILSHYKKTGERILQDSSVRTSSVTSDGAHVHVGYFDGQGLYVNDWYGHVRNADIGVASSRKVTNLSPTEPPKSLSIEWEGKTVKYKKV